MNTAREHDNDIFAECNTIFEYTRAQAIADGLLIDLTSSFPVDTRMFRFPLACTSTVWNLIESAASAEEVDSALYVWDVAYMALVAIKSATNSGSSELPFEVKMPLTENGTEYRLKLVCGPGDDGSPVLTIMLPEED
jgi:hypothetical protein